MVLKICEDAGIKFFEKNIKESELREFDEIMLTATSLEVVPVIQVDDWYVNNGVPGDVNQRLKELFKDLTKSSFPSY